MLRSMRLALPALLWACAAPVPPRPPAPLPEGLIAHPGVGLWRFQSVRTMDRKNQPDVFPDSGYLSLIPEVVTPPEAPLGLRALVTGMSGAGKPSLWAPLPTSDSVGAWVMGGLEIRALPQGVTLSGNIFLRCDLGLECRIPYGHIQAVRVQSS